MNPSHYPSGRQYLIPLSVPEDWSAEDALAIFDLLNDLREVIWNRYRIPIQSLLQEQQRPVLDSDFTEDDIPF